MIDETQATVMAHFRVMSSTGVELTRGYCPLDLVPLQAMEPGSVAEVILPDAPIQPLVEEGFQTHATVRQQAYPPIGDQLDAIWKTLAAHPELLTSEAATMLDQIQDVKTQYPTDQTYPL